MVEIVLTKSLKNCYRLPWNQTSLFGYAGEIVYDVLIGETYLIAGSFMLFFIALCQHHQAFYQMFEHKLNKLKRRNEIKDKQKILRDLIRFHITVKEYEHVDFNMCNGHQITQHFLVFS